MAHTAQQLRSLLYEENRLPDDSIDSSKALMPGDIIVVDRQNDHYYLLISKVNERTLTDKETWVSGYRLAIRQRSMDRTGPLERSDFELSMPLRRIVLPVSTDLSDVTMTQSPQLTQSEAGYIQPPPQELWPSRGKGIRCGTCIYFRAGTCAIVGGDIHGQGCCNLWSHEGRPEVSGFVDGETVLQILQTNLEW